MNKGRFIKFSIMGLLVIFFLARVFFKFSRSNTYVQSICILKVTDHPALDITVKGILDELIQSGYVPGEAIQIRVESAQANVALASQIADKFSNQSPSLVIGVGTMAAQSLLRAVRTTDIPLIFSSVTDPIGAGITSSLKRADSYVTGVSNFIKVGPQLELFKKIQPSLKRLGILYNPGEVNSVSLLEKTEQAASSYGIEIIKQAISRSTDIAQYTRKLAQQVDAIFINNDSTALSNFPIIVKLASEQKVPIYVSDTDVVKMGAVAALGPNQYDIGRQTGQLAVAVLEGKNVSELAILFPQKVDLYLNLDAAEQLGLTGVQKVVHQASQIISRKGEQ